MKQNSDPELCVTDGENRPTDMDIGLRHKYSFIIFRKSLHLFGTPFGLVSPEATNHEAGI